MWESRRDFQRVWEGWEAGFLAFHAFHTLSFPWPAFRPGDAEFTATSTRAMGRTSKEMLVVIVVDECFGDFALIELTNGLVNTDIPLGNFTVRQIPARISRTPRPSLSRNSVRKVAPSAYPTSAAICSTSCSSRLSSDCACSTRKS